MEYKLNFMQIDNYLKQKLNQNENIVVCTYYEVNIKLNISENDENTFLIYARDKLEKLGYDVYFTNSKYLFNNQEKRVKTNEALVAIKSII